MKANRPTMYDTNMFLAAGFRPPTRYANSVNQDGMVLTPTLGSRNMGYDEVYNLMRLQDLKEYTNRYQAVNIPLEDELDQELIERILYYRGSALFYYNEHVQKFQFLPYALNKTIDEYGRFTHANSLPFIGVAADEDGKDIIKQGIRISYGNTSEPNMGVIIHDSSLGLSQKVMPRAQLIQPVLASMATCYMIINTAMFAAADYNLINATNQAEMESLQAQISTINEDIIRGNRFGIVGSDMELKNITTTKAASLQDLWETFNSLDNFRKATAGIDNAGVFNKKERMLSAEQELNGNNDLIFEDSLNARQKAMYLINKIYKTNMWYMEKEEEQEKEPEEVLGEDKEEGGEDNEEI